MEGRKERSDRVRREGREEKQEKGRKGEGVRKEGRKEERTTQDRRGSDRSLLLLPPSHGPKLSHLPPLKTISAALRILE